MFRGVRTTVGRAAWPRAMRCSKALPPDFSHAREFIAEDAWLLGARPRRRLITGLVSTGEELVDRSDFLNTRFYNELLVRYDMDRFVSVPLRDMSTPPLAAFSAFRGVGCPGFDERERLARLVPHLVRAVDTFYPLSPTCDPVPDAGCCNHPAISGGPLWMRGSCQQDRKSVV